MNTTRRTLRSAILPLIGLFAGLTACNDESSSMIPAASTPEPQMIDPTAPPQVPNQPIPNQPNPTPSDPNPTPTPSNPEATGSGSAGHAWCEAKGLKKPSLLGAHSLFVAGPNDVWYLLADPFFGSYNTEHDDPDDDVYVHGRVPKIAHWNGSTLCETNLERLFADGDRRRLAALFSIWGSGPNDIWISGDYGMLLHWDGRSWSVQQSPDGSALIQLLGTRADNMYALGNGGMYHWNGRSWRWVELPGVASPFQEIWIDAKERVWARHRLGYRGCDIYRVDTDGSVKCMLDVAQNAQFYMVKRIGGSGVTPWVIVKNRVEANMVYQYNDSADEWSFNFFTTKHVYSVRAFADDDVWFGGEAVMIHYDGSRFTKYEVPSVGNHVTGWILDIQGSSSRDMWGIVGGVLGGEAGFRGNLDGFTRMQ